MVVAENEVNAVLKCLLEAENAPLNIDELRLLIEGQFAAPTNIDPDSWMSLVVPDPSDDLREAYNQIEVGKKIVIDLGQVTITTSRGMATLLSIIIEGEEKEQEFCLCNVSEPCMVIIDAMNILEYVEGLEIFDNLEEGIAHFS